MKCFYGWRVLAAATIGLSLGLSNIGGASFGLFVIPLSQAFGWGRGDISIAFFLIGCTIVVIAPLAGMLIDRFGVRRVLLPSIVLFALVVASLSRLDGNIKAFYLSYVLLTIAGIGTIPATYTRVVITWFDRRRGLAIGIAMAGVGLGATMVPPIVQFAMAHFGWRAGYLALAGLVLFVAFPAVALLLHERPEERVLAPNAHMPTGSSSELGHEFSDCLRMRTFWLMALGFPLSGLFTSAMLVHLVPLLQDRKLDTSHAVLGASMLGVALTFGRLVCGALMDRFHAPRVVVGCLLGPVFGLAVLASGANGIETFVAVVLVGFGIGAELDFMSYLVSRYFDARVYGRTYGVMYATFSLGTGFGSLAMGYVQQHTGSYDLALWVLCATTVLALVPFSLLGPYPTLNCSPAAAVRLDQAGCDA